MRLIKISEGNIRGNVGKELFKGIIQSFPGFTNKSATTLHGSPDGGGVWGEWTCVCVAESLCCSPETITTLLTGYGGGFVAKWRLTLAIPWTVACQSPLSVGFSRQEYWSGLPFPSPGDLPDPEIEPGFSVLQADDLPTEL